ncbi:MAG: ABC transporter permease [Hespellia sp.]|nr:ABC transporter permease [Hespellia sp.]
MNFIKRAGLYCFRQRFKTLILFLVLTIISTFILTGIAIRDASVGATADVQTAIGGKLLLELDTEGHMSSGQNSWGTVQSYNGDLITNEIVDAISKVDGVVDYNSEDKASFYGAAIDFKYLPASFNLSYTSYGEASSYTATLSSEKCTEFQNGKYQLVSGRHMTPKDKNVVLISKELADYNNLSVGDKINMYCMDSDSKVKFEIVGIYDGTEGTSGNALTVDEIPANCGYVDYAMMFETFGKDYLNGYQQLTIYVEDPVSIQNVYDKVKALPELKGKTLKLSIDTDDYDVVATPLDSLQSLVNTLIIIISFVSTAILTLLLTIWIRGRKKEIGILLSTGKSKRNIIAQFFTETVMVAMVAFASSALLGKLIAGKASDFLLSRVTSGTANLNIQISAGYLLPVYMIGIVLIAVSVAVASWTVIRLKPRDILSKMS